MQVPEPLQHLTEECQPRRQGRIVPRCSSKGTWCIGHEEMYVLEGCLEAWRRLTVLTPRFDQGNDANGVGKDTGSDIDFISVELDITAAGVDCLTSHDVSGLSVDTSPYHAESTL